MKKLRRFAFLSLSLGTAVVLGGASITAVPVHAASGHHKTYAALGDSVAAGLGLPPTAAEGSSRCGRSAEAYPTHVAHDLRARLIFTACSGATAGDLATKQAVHGPNITPQLDTAFASGKPDIITITAGANDMHWLDFIRSCYLTSCDTAGSTLVVDTLLAAYKAKIYYALADIYARSGGAPPHVYMTGYYSLGTSSCLQSLSNQAITGSEINWLRSQTAKLNDSIATVASHFWYVSYVPINFDRHGLCAHGTNRWVQSVNDPAPFHPTATGQNAIARMVTSAIKQ